MTLYDKDDSKELCQSTIKLVKGVNELIKDVILSAIGVQNYKLYKNELDSCILCLKGETNTV
jgi:hypothetical protein